MKKQTIDETIIKMVELKKQIKTLQNQFDILKDSLKNEMDINGMDTLHGDVYYCYYKDIQKQVVDNDKLKEDNLYNFYLKQTEYKMFDYQLIK